MLEPSSEVVGESAGDYHPTLRDWAENSVVRLVEEHRNRPRNDEHDTGLILWSARMDSPHLKSRRLKPVASEQSHLKKRRQQRVRTMLQGSDHRFGLALLIGALIGGELSDWPGC